MDEKRKHMLPELIRFACDPHLDEMTRCWVLDALRDITGENFGSDPQQWRTWFTTLTGLEIKSGKADPSLVSAAWLQP